MSIKLGATGPDVGALQQRLVESGYAITQDELAKQLYGVATITALRAFQAAHVGPDGHALAEDGIVGPATSWALDHPNGGGGAYTASGWWSGDLRQARAELVPVLQWSIAQIGEHEIPDGSNRSPKIDVWTGSLTLAAGVAGPPWCAYFASAAYGQYELGSPFGVLASAWKIREWALQKGRVLPDAVVPVPGDLFVILRGDGHGHTGLICWRFADGRVCTIEGNSGNAVRGLIRDRSQFACIVRPVPIT